MPAEGGSPQLLVGARGENPDARLVARWPVDRVHRAPEGRGQGVNSDVWVVDVASGEERNLTGHRSADGPVARSDPPGMFLPPDLAWSPYGDAVYVGLRVPGYVVRGAHRPRRVGPAVLGGEVGWFAFGVAPSAGAIAATGSGPEDPGELVVAAADGSDRERSRRSGGNGATASSSAAGAARVRRLRRPALEAWLQHPAGSAGRAAAADPAHPRRPALADRCPPQHGVPPARRGRVPRPVHESARRHGLRRRLFAGQCRRLGRHRRRGPARGRSARCGARPDIDASKVGVTGESYGGWMTNWLDRHDRPVCGRRRPERHQRHALGIPDDRGSTRLRLGHGWAAVGVPGTLRAPVTDRPR